jgi:serine/threonine-protein kinase
MTALMRIEKTSRYRPVATIGRGGMAEAVLALLDAGGVSKVVVLKRIWPDLGTDPDFVTMFHDEARLAIRLNHPNVVQTLEVVQDAEQLAIAMEYLHGQPLSAVLNHHLTGSHQLSLALRLRIFIDILAGLHYAHELTDYGGNPLGVVHRDVNPHNVFVTYDGQVKLMDFGVAKTVAAAYQTRPGAIKGKLAYLAPEYLRSDAVDRRADIFATGVMLWELLAGRRLWNGMREAQIVHHLASGVPMPALPPDAIRPPVLDVICARALAMNPGDRYQTAAELEHDLQNAMAGAADSHARTLGRVISHAFSAARAAREALIAQALEGTAQSWSPSDWVAASRAMKESPRSREQARPQEATWAREIDAFIAAADDLLDVTVVDPSMVERAEQAVVEQAVVPRIAATPPPPPPARRRRESRFGGALAGFAVAAALSGLIVVELRRQPTSPVAPAPVTAPATAAETAPPRETFAHVAPPLPPLPPSLVAGVAREAAASPTTVEAAARARRPTRWRARQETAAASAEEQSGAAAFESPTVERRRAASVRSIDESDPFK